MYQKTYDHNLTSSGAATAVIYHLDMDPPGDYYLPYDDIIGDSWAISIHFHLTYPQGLFGRVDVSAICDIPSITIAVQNPSSFYAPSGGIYPYFVVYLYAQADGSISTLPPGNYLVTMFVTNPNNGVVNTYTLPIILFQGLFAYVYGYPDGITFAVGDTVTPVPVWRAFASAEATNTHCEITIQSGPSDITFLISQIRLIFL